jgi:hypothetical protein
MVYECMLPINHANQLQPATDTQKTNFFPIQIVIFAMFLAMSQIFVIGKVFGSIFLPNIRFRPKRENPFSLDD